MVATRAPVSPAGLDGQLACGGGDEGCGSGAVRSSGTGHAMAGGASAAVQTLPLDTRAFRTGAMRRAIPDAFTSSALQMQRKPATEAAMLHSGGPGVMPLVWTTYARLAGGEAGVSVPPVLSSTMSGGAPPPLLPLESAAAAAGLAGAAARAPLPHLPQPLVDPMHALHSYPQFVYDTSGGLPFAAMPQAPPTVSLPAAATTSERANASSGCPLDVVQSSASTARTNARRQDLDHPPGFRNRRRMWTSTMDQRLREAVKELGTRWTTIKAHPKYRDFLADFSRQDLSRKWYRLLGRESARRKERLLEEHRAQSPLASATHTATRADGNEEAHSPVNHISQK